MEKEDFEGIVAAVTKELKKLDRPEEQIIQERKAEPEVVFECPECGGKVKSASAYCQYCGCELEWEE